MFNTNNFSKFRGWLRLAVICEYGETVWETFPPYFFKREINSVKVYLQNLVRLKVIFLDYLGVWGDYFEDCKLNESFCFN